MVCLWQVFQASGVPGGLLTKQLRQVELLGVRDLWVSNFELLSSENIEREVCVCSCAC